MRGFEELERSPAEAIQTGHRSQLTHCSQRVEPLHKTFTNFIEESGDAAPDKFRALVNCVPECHLLENKSLNLEAAHSQALTLDLAQRSADAYTSPIPHTAALVPERQAQPSGDQQQQPTKEEAERSSPGDSAVAAAYLSKRKCYFCGNALHSTGHFAKVCKSKASGSTTAALYNPSLLTIAATYPKNLSHAATNITVNGHSLKALIDSCSSDSFICEEIAQKLNLTIVPVGTAVSIASKSLNASSPEFVTADLVHLDQRYPRIQLGVLKDLCCDVILGYDFQKQHQSVTFQYGGNKLSLKITGAKPVCVLATADIDEPSLFPNLPQQCKPIAVKSSRYSQNDQLFVKDQISHLRSKGIIEPSISPWRAQVVAVKDPLGRHKKRLCIDYSQNINQYTELDAYPLPRIEDMVHDLAKYKGFSTFDLKSAYHQISIKESERKYTAFEGAGEFFQFCRIPFGVTNGVAAFQRAMDKLVEDENLKDTFPYLDNITVGGLTQAEHDENVQKFLEVVRKRKLTLNEVKSVVSVPTISVLGYCVGNNVIKPDPDRLRPLQELPPPTNMGSLRRAQGLFAYYAKWIPGFSDMIHPLVNTNTFPLSEPALAGFNSLKKQLMDVSLRSMDESLPFVVECDASEVAVSAVLNQGGRPVAFMSRTLQGSELHYPAVEKEATAIIEAVHKWSHFLARRHFTLITDQRSVMFMLDSRKRTKIKNNKIQEWRFQRCSSLGNTLPSWLLTPGPVLLRRHVRSSKHEPLTDQVQLMKANPMYANVKYPDGRESAVSTRDLAPSPEGATIPVHQIESLREMESPNTPGVQDEQTHVTPEVQDAQTHESSQTHDNRDSHVPSEPTELRRSTRVSRPPDCYGWD
ncbi:uncharacterized protein LOC135199749 [Macrobrachium nipponense]|uniref:uncharacterized protein LOC135199749 n=1 Tax=Macrobrachium nipponense TaxID=159736 RepID=UPI0030C896CB